MLQALNLFWLFLILPITYNILFKNVKRDVRSDEEEVEDSIGKNEAAPKRWAQSAAGWKSCSDRHYMQSRPRTEA